jgi:hypothetical protein
VNTNAYEEPVRPMPGERILYYKGNLAADADKSTWFEGRANGATAPSVKLIAQRIRRFYQGLYREGSVELFQKRDREGVMRYYAVGRASLNPLPDNQQRTYRRDPDGNTSYIRASVWCKAVEPAHA